MNEFLQTVNLQYTCDSCGELNEVTATDVRADYQVACSACGEPLGTVGDLVDKAANLVADQRLREAAE